MIASLILIISGGVPELPSSKPESTYSVSPDIKAYLAENILAIGAFIIYLTISIAYIGLRNFLYAEIQMSLMISIKSGLTSAFSLFCPVSGF